MVRRLHTQPWWHEWKAVAAWRVTFNMLCFACAKVKVSHTHFRLSMMDVLIHSQQIFKHWPPSVSCCSATQTSGLFVVKQTKWDCLLGERVKLNSPLYVQYSGGPAGPVSTHRLMRPLLCTVHVQLQVKHIPTAELEAAAPCEVSSG